MNVHDRYQANFDKDRFEVYKQILNRLTVDQQFRLDFPSNPEKTLRQAGIACEDPQILREIVTGDWVKDIAGKSGFNDKNVLRCSVGY